MKTVDFSKMTEWEIRELVADAKKALRDKLPLKDVCRITLYNKGMQVYMHGTGKYIAVEDDPNETFGFIAYSADMATAPDGDWKACGPAGYTDREEFLEKVNHDFWDGYKM